MPTQPRALDEGIYSVADVCRILQPSMTPRKVHYWLDTGLLGEPVRWGERGHPTLLSFQQLLKVRTVQHLRDELLASLPKVREAFAWVLANLFAETWQDFAFTLGTTREVVVKLGDERMSIPTEQGVLPTVLPELEQHMLDTRSAWETRRLSIPGRPRLVSDARILSGSPVVSGTRLETAVIATFAEDRRASTDSVYEIVSLYPQLDPIAVTQALEFEGAEVAA
ncbi:MAG: DUF433 domain-containing protein [Actinomycetota bacterium]